MESRGSLSARIVHAETISGQSRMVFKRIRLALVGSPRGPLCSAIDSFKTRIDLLAWAFAHRPCLSRPEIGQAIAHDGHFNNRIWPRSSLDKF